MSVSRVQFKHSYVSTTSTFNSSVSVGNIIVVATSASDNNDPGTSITVTDNLGNSYSQIGLLTQITNGITASTCMALFYAPVTSGGACTVTVHWSGTNIFDIGLTVAEYSGLVASPTVTGYTVDNDTNPLLTSVSASKGDLIFAMWADEASNVYSSPTAGFTTFQHDSAHYDAQSDYQNVSSTSTVSAGFNLTATSHYSGVITADFTPAYSFVKETAATVWRPQSGQGEFVSGSSENIVDDSGNFLVDASSNNIVDSGNTFNDVPATTWVESDGS